MFHSVFFALMAGSPSPQPHLTRNPFPPHTPPASALPPPTPPPPGASHPAPVPRYTQFCSAHLQHCVLEAACLAAHALPPGRGMDLNPELLSASRHSVNWFSGVVHVSVQGA